MGIETIYVRVADDVTDEIVDATWDIVEGFHLPGRIDWGEVWDRLESYELEDGRSIDLGEDLESPALKKIKSKIREIRKSNDL